MILAQLPTLSNGATADGVVWGFILLLCLDRAINIFANIKKQKEDTMPRGAIRDEIARLEKKIDAVHEERRATTAQLFTEIKQMGTSVTNSLNDFSRALGRIEGSHEMAGAIKHSLDAMAVHSRASS